MKASVGAGKDLAPEGTHVVACIQIIDKGTKEGTKGDDYRAFAYGLELTEEDGDEPVTVFPMLAAQYDKEGALKIGAKSKLGKAYAAFMGKSINPEDEIEIDATLGRYAMATIVHKTVDSKTYANVEAIVALTKGMKPRRYKSELKSLYLEEGEFDQEVFDDLPDFIQEEIEKSPEYAKLFPRQPKGKPEAKGGKGKPEAKKGKGKGKDEDVPF